MVSQSMRTTINSTLNGERCMLRKYIFPNMRQVLQLYVGISIILHIAHFQFTKLTFEQQITNVKIRQANNFYQIIEN
jgi:hypothetical protein